MQHDPNDLRFQIRFRILPKKRTLSFVLQRSPITRDLSPSKGLRQSGVLVDVNHRKAVEIILNSEKISRQQNQEIDSFIRWRMVNFMKVDFQARVS